MRVGFLKAGLVKSLFGASAVSGACGSGSSESPAHIVVDDLVEVNPSDVGDLKGRVLVPVKNGNYVDYVGYEGGCVMSIDSGGKSAPSVKTIGGGIFSITKLQTGSYTIRASEIKDADGTCRDIYGSSRYVLDEISAVVIKQSLVDVGNLSLGTYYWREKQILFGKVYDKNGKPLSNKKISLHDCSVGISSRDRPLYTTTASSEGSYAFNTDGKYILAILGGVLIAELKIITIQYISLRVNLLMEVSQEMDVMF